MTKSRNGAKQHLASLRQGIEEEAAKVVPLIEKFTAAMGNHKPISESFHVWKCEGINQTHLTEQVLTPSTNKMFNKNLSESGRVFMIFPWKVHLDRAAMKGLCCDGIFEYIHPVFNNITGNKNQPVRCYPCFYSNCVTLCFFEFLSPAETWNLRFKAFCRWSRCERRRPPAFRGPWGIAFRGALNEWWRDTEVTWARKWTDWTLCFYRFWMTLMTSSAFSPTCRICFFSTIGYYEIKYSTVTNQRGGFPTGVWWDTFPWRFTAS